MSMEHETTAEEIGELLNTDESVDGRMRNTPGGGGKVTPEQCAAWRVAVRERYRRRSHLAEEAPFDITAMAVGNHVGGDCSHTHDVPPVEGDR